MRQQYSLDELQSIADNFKDVGRIKNHFLFTSGFENSNYYIESDNGKFVIKVFEGIGVSNENILFEIEVMAHCFKNGIKTPVLIETIEDKYYTLKNGKIAIIMKYIDGENMLMKQIPENVISEIGEETGKMDLLLKSFKDGSKTRQNYEWDLKNFLNLEPSVSLLPSEIDKKLITDVFNSFKAIQDKFNSLPKGITHNDVAAHNILARNGKLTGIIDFSDMAFSPYIQNIAVFLCQTIFSYNWMPNQAAIFIKEYGKHIPISNDELNILYDLVRARFASIIVEFNRWNVVYGEDEQRTKYINDNYQFLKRFSGLNRQEFLKFLI